MKKTYRLGTVVLRISQIVGAYLDNDDPKRLVVVTTFQGMTFAYNYKSMDEAIEHLNDLQYILEDYPE
jgi:hypothetical protein